MNETYFFFAQNGKMYHVFIPNNEMNSNSLSEEFFIKFLEIFWIYWKPC